MRAIVGILCIIVAAAPAGEKPVSRMTVSELRMEVVKLRRENEDLRQEVAQLKQYRSMALASQPAFSGEIREVEYLSPGKLESGLAGRIPGDPRWRDGTTQWNWQVAEVVNKTCFVATLSRESSRQIWVVWPTAQLADGDWIHLRGQWLCYGKEKHHGETLWGLKPYKGGELRK